MGTNGGFAAAVCLLCCAFVGGASAAFYSVPADPRHHPTPSPGPASVPRGHYHHGPATWPSPRQHHNRGISPLYPAPAPASPPHYSAPAPVSPHYSTPAPATPHHSAPSPSAGADDLPPRTLPPPQQATTTPHFGFPLEPTVGVAAARPAGAPASGEGYPFIGSNPTVPLPTGVTDTATVRPLPDTGGGNADADGKMVGRAASEPVRARTAMIGLLAVFSTVLLSSCS